LSVTRPSASCWTEMSLPLADCAIAALAAGTAATDALGAADGCASALLATPEGESDAAREQLSSAPQKASQPSPDTRIMSRMLDRARVRFKLRTARCPQGEAGASCRVSTLRACEENARRQRPLCSSERSTQPPRVTSASPNPYLSR
jgi:hypothetical protein